MIINDFLSLTINLFFILDSILIDNQIDWIPNEWFDLPNLEYM